MVYYEAVHKGPVGGPLPPPAPVFRHRGGLFSAFPVSAVKAVLPCIHWGEGRKQGAAFGGGKDGCGYAALAGRGGGGPGGLRAGQPHVDGGAGGALRPPRRQGALALLPARGNGEGLEEQVHTLQYIRGEYGGFGRILLVDRGLTEEGRKLCELLAGEDRWVSVCAPETVETYLN